MVIRNFAKYLTLALVAMACTVKETVDSQAPNPSEPGVSSPYVPGRAIVEFDDALTELVEAGEVTKAPGLEALMLDLGIDAMERVFPDAGEFEARHRREGLHRFYYVNFAKDQPVTKAVSALQEMSGVVSATPDRTARLRSYFNDPYLSRQWHLVNTATPSADIHVQEVWQQYTVGTPSVVVAVMDEPIQYNHDDLAANMWNDGSGHYGYNQFLNNYTLNYGPSEGHGTHVAGVISAVNNNGKGISSVAGGDAALGRQGVRLMSIPIFSMTQAEEKAEEKDEDGKLMLSGYTWAADHGAVISQNSWGYTADGCLGDEPDGRVSAEELAQFKRWTINDIPSLKKALDYFMKYAGCDKDTGDQLPDSPMKGGLVFFAAGNEGDLGVDYDPICAYEPVIAVGAFRESGKRASYSNYGSWVDIAAPGGEGTSSSNSVWSTVSSSRSTSQYEGTGWAGTSMACPHASGVAALIISYFGGPGFTADNCRDILFKGLGSTIGGDKPIGQKLDALAAFDYGVQHYPAGGGSSSEEQAPVITLETDQVTVKAHEARRINFSVYDPNGDAFTLAFQTGSAALAVDEKNRTLSLDGKKAPAGTYRATITASDGKLSSQAVLTYTILENHAPEVRGTVANALLTGLQYVKSIGLEGLFYDADGEVLTIEADASEAPCVTTKVSEGKLSLLPAQFGQGRITLTARDALGKTAQIHFLAAVADPANPVSVSPVPAADDVYFTLETEELTPVTLTLYSATGALVTTLKTSGSVFEPVHLDISAYAPGRYTAVLSYLDQERRLRIIKY